MFKKQTFVKLYKDLFYIPKREKLPDKFFRCRMIFSALSILACVTLMVSSAFAWFSVSFSVGNSTLESATYSVTVDHAENGTCVCPLAYEDKHTFEIKAAGTATTGYCKIQVGDQVYYTAQIPRGSSLTLTIQAARDTEIRFTPQWGTSSYYITEGTCGSEIIHSTTPHAVYEVEPTARLANIAAHYGVPESDILVYNNLSGVAVAEADILDYYSAPDIAAGTVLKIPGAAENAKSYAVPYATYTVEPTADLAAIAKHYGVSVEDIVAFNGTENIAEVTVLKIPNVAPETPAYAVPYATYTVEPTATLADIAKHYGVDEADILSYYNGPEITVGTVLRIPGVSEDAESYAVPYATYTVEATAKIEEISAYYGVSVDDILLYNGIEEISAGLELNIPGVASDFATYVAPVPNPPASTDEKKDPSLTDEKNEPSTEEKSTEEKSTEEKSTEETSTEEPSTEEKSSEETSTEEKSTEETSTEEKSSEETSTEEESTEEKSTEETSTEEKSTEEASTEEKSTEEASTEEKSTEEQPAETPSDQAAE